MLAWFWREHGPDNIFFVKQRRLSPRTFWEGSRFKIMVYDGSTHDSAYVQECRIAQHGDQTWEMYDLWYYIEDQPWGFELPDLRQIQRPDMLFYNHSLPSIMIKLGYSKNVWKKHQKKGQDIWFPFQNGMVSYMLIPLGFCRSDWPYPNVTCSCFEHFPLDASAIAVIAQHGGGVPASQPTGD